jgi:hypothetical protein
MLPVIGALVAGLGLFFVGLNFLTEHLKMLSGRRLRESIATWTKRPLAERRPNDRFSIAAKVKALSDYVMPHSFCTPFCIG